MKIDNNNSIYEDLNKEPLPAEVLDRINLFKDIVNYYKNSLNNSLDIKKYLYDR